jgi:thymidylate synthase ThyX
MAYRMRYVMQFNAREAIHMLELRSSPQGHPAYRRVALEMHRRDRRACRSPCDRRGDEPHDDVEAPELERLESERRAEARRRRRLTDE